MLVNNDHPVEAHGAAALHTADAATEAVSRTGRKWIRTGASVALVGLLAAALFFGGMLYGGRTHGAGQPASSRGAVQPENQAVGWVRYRGAMSDLSLEYPKSWTKTVDSPNQVVLGIAGETGVSVRRESLQSTVDTGNVSNVRAVTDAILGSPKAKLDIVTTDQIQVGDLPGIFYLYYYGAGANRGVHAHYFLFKGHVMYSLVFQVAPAADFKQYAATFDRVLRTFRVE